MIADLLDMLGGLWAWLVRPVVETPWADWRGFWLGQILDDRFVVVWFFPLLAILLLLGRDRLRVGIILTGLAFVGYLCGAAYAVFWLLSCLGFHWLGERFVGECRRTDVWRGGPPLAAGGIIVGWYLATMMLHNVGLPVGVDAWLYEHARWLYPLGTRDMPWEPRFGLLFTGRAAGPPSLVLGMFWNVHNIGTAYLAVRLLHYFSELRRGTIPAERRTRLNFLAYTCYAPGFLQGPVERFAPFQEEMDTCHQRRSWRNVPPAAGRIALGLAKSVFCTWYLWPILHDQLGLGADNRYYSHPERIPSLWLLYAGISAQITWLYLEFSGYCDISAGMARLLGYRQIENFDRPWLAVSFRDFWRRWHISLSFILRDYVYIPLGGSRRRTTINLCLTFIACGMWHEARTQVAAWGLIMGLMVAVNHHWAMWMKRLGERPTGLLPAIRRGFARTRPLPQVFGWVITQHAFVLSLLVLFGGSGAVRVLREIGRRVLAGLAG